MINPFFENKGPKKIEDILLKIKVLSNLKNTELIISDVKDLLSASNQDITFFCITTKQLSNFLPENCVPIEVDNVLVATAIVTNIFYPDAVTDDFDINTLNIEKTSFTNSVDHGQNILIGKNVKIGSNC